MTPIVVVLAAAAVTALLIAGYLFGARAGRAARAAILEERESQGARVMALEARLAAQPPRPRDDQVKTELEGMLAPLLDRERIGRELSGIRVGGGGLGELPKLLDAIAQKAGFSHVVLSDESGLPLAASTGAAEVEALAGTAAFFLTLAERAERAELPRPMSCVVLDETNRMTLHRMFVVGAARYTVSAVSRGMNLAPGALDPALSPLERALTRRELA
ncbi:MAG: hypothetical protein KA978_07180 [Deltaproteobacteria bacterium]|nr:hypothetical protein [Deltaproteobacteria bacterium]